MRPVRPRPRYFDEVDTLTGTSSADSFRVEPLIPFYFLSDLEDRADREAPLREQPEKTEIVKLEDGGEWLCFDFSDCFWVSHGDGTVVEEIDILVYQEQDRAVYLEGYQAPTARSYTYIEDFEPIEDEIIVGGIAYTIKIDENDIPMFTDDIQPANWLNPCNEDGGDCFYL